ncbi:hypothetical protein PHABIO_461 [Pseudomonas phage Phabio]|uniref:Uncharacterized protein n=1 Tax=Pseudomonas phage Phabio TaxID=2006668 RepID=A0A1Y0SZX9_9CAUD|nr:hypothetical protein MZD05_gp458 [Pseudomonas phage Phabio]ARV77089.1 hypothetical protein PHABIO_461 [Pseudomonas phage Phabio]
MTHIKFSSNSEDLVVTPQHIEVHNPQGEGEWLTDDLIRQASRYDSMFHYFESPEEDSDPDCSPTDEAVCIGRIDSTIHTLLSDIINTNDNTLDVHMGTYPSWHRNRDETFTVNAAIENVDWVFDKLEKTYGYKTLFLRADFVAPQGRHGSQADKDGIWHDVFPLIQEANQQNEIIMSALHRDLSHRDSMLVLIDPLTKVYSAGLEEKESFDGMVNDDCEPDPMKYYGWSNWFLKAKYLSDSLHRVYPRNFRNIVIYGAAKLIAQDHLKVTKLQQYLAAMGRTGTRLILVD